MPSKTFSYEIDGLSYTVVLTETENGVSAAITVNEGHMDVNAIYWGDDDFSGPSAGLGGPLNMNGAGSQFEGERVQWDDAQELSRPGLGREGTDKDTYVAEGETLTVDIPGASLDDFDFFGVRATSTSNDAGSIKGVSAVDESDDNDDDDDDDNGDDDEPVTYEKVSFELFVGGAYQILADGEGNEFNNPVLPEDLDGTFEDYLTYFESLDDNTVSNVESVIFYGVGDEGGLGELFRLEGPFEDRDALLKAYDDRVNGEEDDGASGTSELFIAMDSGDEASGDDDEADDDMIAA